MSTSSPLFQSFSARSLVLPNRIVMSPMTRSHSPGGVPGGDVAAYYRRRAEGGTGLLITEGTAIPHAAAVDNPRVPRLHGRESLEGWQQVVDDVHAAGGKIIPQLWHVGPLWGAMTRNDLVRPMRPAGKWGTVGVTSYARDYVEHTRAQTDAMTEHDIRDVINAYAEAARNAVAAGFDGVAIHGGHGYLLDAFLWEDTNDRDDDWGGDLYRRTRFPVEVIGAIRAEIGADLPIFFRFSQHKQQDYSARIARTPDELGVILNALVEAGVDVLDASHRRFDDPAFPGSDLSLAGWAKKLTGAPTMAVGSVGIGRSLRESRADGSASDVVDNIGDVEARVGNGEFDLIAIGRLHLADPAITTTIRTGRTLPRFVRDVHESKLH